MSVLLHRARPWLGTLVEVRVETADMPSAQQAIEAAFVEVAAVHRCMSFHAADSDLSRLHAAPLGAAVEVDPRTFEVLHCALELAERSQGCFDPTIAGELVKHGFLPRPHSPFLPAQRADWRDVEVMDGNRVRLHRPLWLDLGGIAKGYAVDRAVRALLAAGATQAAVNAGGDLRVAGSREEIVHLRGADGTGIAGAVALRDAALASSAGCAAGRYRNGRRVGVHVDGRSRRVVGLSSSASVVAANCMIADALTKLVFAAPQPLLQRLLEKYAAQVAAHSVRHGWQLQGRAA